jgi:putative hydroxymethylpyrimidine transport system substrate-binding protein
VTRHRLLAALLAVVTAAALAACGERKEPTAGRPQIQRLDVMLDYLPNADHAGIYAAMASGAFRRAGLDVRLHTPSDPASPLKLLAAGKIDLAISYEPELLLARDKGLPLMSIGALVQRPLTSIISLGAHAIREPGQLQGKKVGTAGIPYQDAYLKTILARAGIEPDTVKSVNVGFNLVPAMLTKRVDATLGAFWNVEGVDLARRHKDPTILRMDQVGVPTYDELVIVAREHDVRSRGKVLRRFMQALAEGHQAVRADAAVGVDALVKANPDLKRGLQSAEVKATLPAFFPTQPGRPFGFQDPGQWQRYATWMRRNHLLEHPPNAARAFTNEYLPGEGV